MAALIDTEDLIDANEVAEMLGLAHRNSVSLYQRRYSDMPRPVVERAGGRVKLWSRREIAKWRASKRGGASVDESRGRDHDFVVEGAEVIAHITTRLAVELIASGAGDEERGMGEKLLHQLRGDPDAELTFRGTVVIPPGGASPKGGRAIAAVRIPELSADDGLFALRIDELTPAVER